MKKRMLFIYNPKSGKGQIRGKLAEIVDIFVKGGCEVLVHPTQGAGDACRTVEEYQDQVDLVVCCGGDGTLDETAAGLLKSGAGLPLGYIPAGSTNDFANSLNIPRNMLQAAEDIMKGKHFACDVADFNGRTFVYIAGFGLFTDVSYETDQNLKNILGHLAYLVEAGKRIFNVPTYRIKVDAGVKKLEGEYIFGMITNARSVGGIKNITGTGVELNDGLFEVTLIHPPRNPLELNGIIMNLLSPNENRSALIENFKTDRICIESEEKIAWTLDGESGGNHRLARISIRESALDLLIDTDRLRQGTEGKM